MSAHVLIVEEDQDLAAAVGWYLEAAGHRVTTAGVAADVRQALREGPPRLVVWGGLALGEAAGELRRLRATQGLLVLRLGAQSDDGDELAADEYLPGPCGPLELAARVRALLERSSPAVAEPPHIPGLEIHEDARQVVVHGQVVPLTALEFDLLRLFLRHPRAVLSRSQISDALWGDDYYGSLRLVDSHVSHLRRKLQAAGLRPCPLITVRGLGYALRPER